MENIETNNEKPVPYLPSTSAENESNISNQDIEGGWSLCPTDNSDMDSKVSSCDPDPATWFSVREKHVPFWSKATLICNNKNDSDTAKNLNAIISHYFKNSMFYTIHDKCWAASQNVAPLLQIKRCYLLLLLYFDVQTMWIQA